MVRRYPLAFGLLAVAALAAVLLVARWWFGGDAAGTSFRPRDDLAGDTFDVVTPGATTSFTVTAPRRSIPEDETSDLEARRARRGTSFVGVAYERVYGRPVTELPVVLASAQTQRPTLELLAGGKRYPIPGSQRYTKGDRWMAVPGDGRDVRIAVTFDGVTQVVDPRTGKRAPSLADGFYDRRLLIARQRPCRSDAPQRGHLRYYLSCDIGVVGRTPWVPRKGWAPAGREWAVVGVRTYAAPFLRWYADAGADDAAPGARYELTAGRRTITLDGAAPAAELDGARVTPDGFDHDGTLVFPSRPGAPLRLKIALPFTGELDDLDAGVRGYPRRPVVHLDREIDLDG